MKKEKKISRARRIIGDVLLFAVILLTADVAVVMTRRIRAVVLKGEYQKVFIYELGLCAILLLFALDVRFGIFTRWKAAALKGIGWFLRAAAALLSAVILFFCGKVVAGGLVRTAGPANYAVVLGLALENGEATPDLRSRLDTAREYLAQYPGAQLILTGGNADESGRSEADVMREILIGQGVPEDRLIIEDQAKSTRENFSNIAGRIPEGEAAVMISSDYHMDRAVRIAEKAGFTGLMRLPAPSDIFAYGANMLSEVVLNLNDLVKMPGGRPSASSR